MPDASGMVEVARLGVLPCWLAGSLHDATATARRFARHGKMGVVIGIDVVARRAVMAASIVPVHGALFAVDEVNAPHIRRTRAAVVSTSHGPILEQFLAVADALDTDAAGRRTFRLLRALIDDGVDLLPAQVAAGDRRAWTLLQLTRLLFLRFVESEGWLDGRSRFLRDELDRCLLARRDPTRHLLHPLFFGTLNRRPDQRSRFARAFGTVPFLNGGLFEPHPIERRHQLRLPASYWCTAFEALVDRIDVSLEHAPQDCRVTPELLGRAFEGVMAPEERRAAGAFFTPPALVDALVREAVACHLALRLGRGEGATLRALDDPDPVLRRALADVTVLDPAVGSGAFLVGSLAVLHGPGQRNAVRVRHLVTRRLHGTDRHPGAVRLCELRLWLEVLRAMRGRPPSAVTPLPNLDAAVRAGDAIVDPLFGHPLAAGAVARLRSRQRDVRHAHGAERHRAMRHLHHDEARAVHAALVEREASLDRAIAELMSAAGAVSLFGTRDPLTAAALKQLNVLRCDRTEVRTERRRIERDESAAPLAIHAAFAPAIARRGGFDLVVGNPPWVRAQHIPPATRRVLAARYRWWQSGSTIGWGQLPDLSIAFAERGFELLAPSGTLAFLLPAKLVTAGYASACRGALSSRATLHCVADLADDPRAGFDATTYPLALIASRKISMPDHCVRLGLSHDAPRQEQHTWQGTAHWSVAAPAVQRIAARLARDHPQLRTAVRAQLGVKTGANEAFLNPPDALAEWCRPAVRGRDLRAFRVITTTRLLWPADAVGAPWPHLPAAVRAHLARHEERLRRRADQSGECWWRLFRVGPATSPWRVAWRDLALRLEAVALPHGDPVPLNSCYVAALPSRDAADALTAWLNASVVNTLARAAAEPASGGYARFGARAIGSLPLPATVLGDPVLIRLGASGRDGEDVQQSIDDHVAGTLSLDDRARRELDVALATHRR